MGDTTEPMTSWDELYLFCDDEDCTNYGQRLVDRGYGYNVCPSSPLNDGIVNNG